MNSKFILNALFLLFFAPLFSQSLTVAERLGYAKDAKLLIIHADDLGVTHSENRASIAGLEETPVNSASIMVPCPWFPEIAAYARKNKGADLGLHLTLTSEWKYYKWGPVTSTDVVPSLVNEDGYFYSSVDSLIAHASPKHVEIELRNQVKKAYQFGIDVTHLDAHMGAAVSTPKFLEVYIKIGKEFQLPVLLDGRIYTMGSTITELLNETDVVADAIPTKLPEDQEKGTHQYYETLLNNLNPGLNCLLIHLAFDDAEMQAVTVDHPEWGAAWRQADYEFFSDTANDALLKENNIVLVTWREIRDKIVRGK
ncbi:polysaccharide deacetylase family protein [Arenibacter sp. GZD96]|uniref:polysaccharide deacetylase family protein n=1 Tax=Aurantibrevibacter litoralis TaxID=3106030 RepID=UPI002AFF145E|nr:polysaccharide deacetylase family protein [Arenibacter sp. GZD-96]MEA1785338.1 polysaccharide deacetylase family protein [Arenibacter sp. GZD-96]